MQVNVIRDSSGKAVATFETESGQGAQVSPELPKGFKVDQLDVTVDYSKNPGSFYH